MESQNRQRREKTNFFCSYDTDFGVFFFVKWSILLFNLPSIQVKIILTEKEHFIGCWLRFTSLHFSNVSLVPYIQA